MEHDNLSALASEISAVDSGLEIKNRRYFLRTYNDVFIGNDVSS